MSQFNNFDELGRDYQLQLVKEILTDHKFGLSIMDILEPTYFSQVVFQRIINKIKAYYQKHEGIVGFGELKQQIYMDFPQSAATDRDQILDTLTQVENCTLNNLNVKQKATRFCRFRKLQEALLKAQKLVARNVTDDYDDVEKIIKDAITFRDVNDPQSLYDSIETDLDDESRAPIRTGVSGIDEVLCGGLARGEVGVVIAPLGVGKSTFLTKVANTAYVDEEVNVLQVFFEDKVPAIRRKHYTAMTGVPLNQLSEKKDEVAKVVRKRKEQLTNHLWLQPMPPDGSTVNHIRKIIKQLLTKGHKVDMLVLDYVDCLTLEKEYSTQAEWEGEGKIMRQLEALAEEFNIAVWTAVQGNRSSTATEVVKVENMGGNLKKAQFAHFLMSIGKTLEQKEQKIATISILKNRMGDDGMVFANCKFDNGKMLIDTADRLTEKGFEDQKAEKQKNAQAEALKKYREMKYGPQNASPEPTTL